MPMTLPSKNPSSWWIALEGVPRRADPHSACKRISRILMRCSPELLVEVVKGRDLSLVDFAPSAGEVEPGGAVNLHAAATTQAFIDV